MRVRLEGTLLTGGAYAPYATCTASWLRHRLAAGWLTTLEFVDFCVERSSNCTFDYVELREGGGSTDDTPAGSTGRLVGRLCGDGATGVFHTTAARLSVTFVSDATVECRGFWAFYRQTRTYAHIYVT